MGEPKGGRALREVRQNSHGTRARVIAIDELQPSGRSHLLRAMDGSII